MYKIYIHSIRQMMKLWSADRLIGKRKKKSIAMGSFFLENYGVMYIKGFEKHRTKSVRGREGYRIQGE